MSPESIAPRDLAWPALPLAEWQDTCETLHMYTQIVGKVPLALTPLINHWWEVALFVTARGLTTSPIPYRSEVFEINFDFFEHKVDIQTSWGGTRTIPLFPRAVADFYDALMASLHSLGIEVKIWPMPVEVPNPIRFDQDRTHASYNTEYVHRFWRSLVTVHNLLQEFRARFIGKDSPIQFFWGTFDLCVSRFSGRRAPERPGADRITREAYSHEVSSAGFWPGGGEIKGAAFYSYTAPEPNGFPNSPIHPDKAFYHPKLHEFLLMYDDVRRSPSPRATVLDFFETTYEAGANLATWDRRALEREPAHAA
jgi:Family of unknown function (DUF5996)